MVALLYLRRHPVSSLLLAAIYLVAGAIFHDRLQEVVRVVQGSLVNQIVTLGILAAAVVFLAQSAFRLLLSAPLIRRYGLLLPSWGITIGLAVLAYVTLMSVYTEFIHYLQYAPAAVLIAAGTRRAGLTAILTSVAGIADEAYQYWDLHRGWGIYFDFNDVILNTLATMVGVLWLATVFPAMFASTDRRRSVLRSTDLSGALIVGALFSAALCAGILIADPLSSDRGSWQLLNRLDAPTAFWQAAYWSHHLFHVLRPWEALIVWIGVIAMYVPLTRSAALGPEP